MEEDERKALYRALSLAEENNAILRKMRGAQKNASMVRAIYWVVVIGLAIAGYYAVKPYLSTAESLYASAKQLTGMQLPTVPH